MNTFVKLLVAFMLVFLANAMASASDGDILLGPGDVLRISVFEQPDLSLEVRVSESGNITYPLIGAVHVGGDTAAQAEKKIATLLERGGFLKSPHVNIIVAQIQSQQVSVFGQVNRPGRYPLDGARTLSDILAMAGGIGSDGGDTVTVLHNSKDGVVRELVDIAEMMRSGDLKHNFLIAGGDIVYVDRVQRFYIYGEVQRPSQYRLEHNMTVLQALSLAGGLTLRGTERGIKIKRVDESGVMQVLDAKHDDLIRQNDVVYVKESLF